MVAARRPSWFGVEGVIFVYFCVFAALGQAKIEYLNERVCASLVNDTVARRSHGNEFPHNTTDCRHPDVLSEAAIWSSYFTVLESTPSLLLVGSLGGLSEAWGRTAIMRLVMFASLLSAGLVAATAIFHLPLFALVIASGINGFSGHYPAMLMAAFSNGADVSSREGRTAKVAQIEGSIFLGLAIGALGGGLATKRFGFERLFVGTTMAATIGCLCTLFIPESLPHSMRTPFQGFRRTNTLSSLGLFLRSRSLLMGSIALSLILSLLIGLTSTNILYLLNKYDFTATEIGVFNTIDNITKGITLVLVLPWLGPALRQAFKQKSRFMVDKIYVTIGLFFLIVQFCGYSFTPTSVRGALFGVAAGGIFTGCAAPGMRSMLSKQVGPDEQGRIFSAIATVEAITSLISQVGFNALLSATAGIDHGRCIFYVAAGLAATAMMIVLTGGLDGVAVLRTGIQDRDDELPQPVEQEPLLPSAGRKVYQDPLLLR